MRQSQRPDARRDRRRVPADAPSVAYNRAWWWLAIVVGALWSIECVTEGNTLLEMLMVPVMVAV
jgi:hypothetical protein